MSGICGWSGFGTNSLEYRRLIERMAAALTRFGGGTAQAKSAERCAVALAARHAGTALRAEGDLVVALAETPRRRTAGAEPSALARSFLESGARCLQSLSGGFALAILDRRDGAVLLAIDRMGIAPLHYSVVNGGLIFGSTMDAITLHPLAKPEVDPQALYDYVYFHMIPGPRTIYRTIERLLPGQYLMFRDGKASTHWHWQPRFEEQRRRPFAELKDEFLTVLGKSVQAAADDADTGTFLSGGTDSSTIAGLLGKVTGEPARTYSIGFEAEGYDEIGYARIAARHFGTRHHEYYVTPDDVVKAIPQIASVHDQPFGNSSAVPTVYCARLAKEDGIKTLLGGDGGDELFGGNTRYAKQYLYSVYSNLPARVRTGLIEPVAFALPEGIPVIGKAQRYIRNASQPMPGRYDNYNLLERIGSATVFSGEFLETVDQRLPHVQVRQVYESIDAQSLINRMLALDFKYTLADNDLPKVTRSCELAGVGVAFPMLDDAVVAFSTRLPPELKLKGTRLRYFFKEALRGFLPREIISKKKHGFGMPFGTWLQTNKALQSIVCDSLNDLKRRHIVRAEFTDQLPALCMKSHAEYYGSMGWVLVMLEQWFKQHRDAS